MINDIHITPGEAGSQLKKILNQITYSQVVVLVDDNTEIHCLPTIEKEFVSAIKVRVPAGESHKNIETCMFIWNELTKEQIDRKAIFVNLGGGVIGDMGGFCASTYKRGINFIQIPTTLLAQVDASIGGKLGVDFKGYKNHIGLFKAPITTIIDPSFLTSLKDEELLSGFSEMLKHAVISDEKHFHELIEVNPITIAQRPDLIEKSIGIKKEIVKSDPDETGMRKLLNYGHTVGHAIERTRLNKKNPLLHGFAVAMGMICENFIAQEITRFNKEESYKINEYIKRWYKLPVIHPDDFESICLSMQHDKKNENGKILLTIPKKIGSAAYNQSCTKDQILSALYCYNEFIQE